MAKFLRWAAIPTLLLAGGCGSQSDPTAGKSGEQLRREIEAVATPPVPPEQRPPPPRLAPLTAAEVNGFVQGRASCLLVQMNQVLFATVGATGIARVDRQIRELRAKAPVAGSGGFFAAPGVSLSVGRVGQYAGEAAAYAPDWRAAVAVGGLRGRKPERFEARWRCVPASPAQPAQPQKTAS